MFYTIWGAHSVNLRTKYTHQVNEMKNVHSSSALIGSLGLAISTWQHMMFFFHQTWDGPVAADESPSHP
jgi:hypothetical protein